MKKHIILRNILIDAVCAGLALVVFALFHHVLPRKQQSLGIVITNPYLDESRETNTGGSLPDTFRLTASAGCCPRRGAGKTGPEGAGEMRRAAAR